MNPQVDRANENAGSCCLSVLRCLVAFSLELAPATHVCSACVRFQFMLTSKCGDSGKIPPTYLHLGGCSTGRNRDA